MSEPCPKCGAAFYQYANDRQTRLWHCESREYRGRPIVQSDACRIRELTAQLAAANARAEKAEEELGELNDWYVTDHERGDAPLRGPYRHALSAGAVRSEMERHSHWDKFNLGIVRIPQPALTQEDA